MRTLAALILAVGVLAGCAAGPPLPSQTRTSPMSTTAHGISIGVVHEGWHTGLVLPAAAFGGSHLGLRSWFPDAKYLVVGWGNRSFYMAPHPGLATAISALFPSPSALYVRAIQGGPRNAFPLDGELSWVCLSSAAVRRLSTYLTAYLHKRQDGNPIELGKGPLPNSRFFASRGTYDAFHTCNTWTIAALRFAGLPVNVRGVVFADQVMSEVHDLPSCAQEVTTSPAAALPAQK